MVPTAHDVSFVFIELGLVIVGLAVLARLTSRWGFSAIPLYLLAGLAFGNGGLAPLRLSENFDRIGAEIGVLLLLFMLGLECSGDGAVKLIDALAGESPASAGYPVGTVVISGDGAGDQTVGSPDVNVLDGWTQVWSAPTGGQAKQQVVA
jgi:Kef-type K+ transport system membrane component KefB